MGRYGYVRLDFSSIEHCHPTVRFGCNQYEGRCLTMRAALHHIMQMDLRMAEHLACALGLVQMGQLHTPNTRQ